ncbi:MULTISPECIES: thiol:disulfide interchange protein DsbG [Halomonadaceae]|uniref:thiol:disulfide interchange protein DsbG n=1 Tax=Halomonadaceae TaxID=28256 RepID=UPI00159A802A|nr:MULTISPECIES: thiol:disulfide interchange protein DsbG [Halomonas]QJQ96928.1 thiol:disulfide interchange protein DsbG [Halomonas sp. PA5]
MRRHLLALLMPLMLLALPFSATWAQPIAPTEAAQLSDEAAAAWAALEASAWIREGEPDAERVIYVFTDPYCPYCHRLWQATRPWVEAGKVQMRHVMVGLMARDSPRTAISLLAEENPSEALLAHLRGETTPRLETLPRALEEALLDNHLLMESFGAMATPSLIYHVDELEMAHGLPDEQELERIMGSALQE